MIQPKNLFLTKHFLSIIGLFWLSTVTPAIEKAISGELTKKDVGYITNSLVATIFGASIKGLESNIYTPKYMPGKNKQDLLEPVNQLIDTSSIISSDLISSETNINQVVNPNALNLVIITKQKTYFKVKPLDSSILSNAEKLLIEANTNTNIKSFEADLATNHIKFLIGPKTWYAYKPHISILEDGIEQLEEVKINSFIPTIEQCNSIYGTRLTVEEYIDFVNCLKTFNINTKLDIANFMAQTAHESGGLRYMKELGGSDYFTQNYEYRDDLGNIQPGDGALFAGSGLIQLTGRANYTSFSNYINDPKVIELGQDYVAEKYPFSSAGWFWMNNKLSSYINDEGATIEQVSTVINGANPANGLEERIFYFNRSKELFNII